MKKTLHNARERKRPTSMRRTIAGKRKIEGLIAAEAVLQAEGHRRQNENVIAAYLKSKGVATKARYIVNTKGQKVMVTKPSQALNKGAVSKLLCQV